MAELEVGGAQIDSLPAWSAVLTGRSILLPIACNWFRTKELRESWAWVGSAASGGTQAAYDLEERVCVRRERAP